MFTGLIETTGRIKKIGKSNRSVTLDIIPLKDEFDVSNGASVAIDGVCLTVESIKGKIIQFTAVAETLSRTTLGLVREGTTVNLERSLRLSDRLDGHFVLGHVDAVGKIMADKKIGNSLVRTIGIPSQIRQFLPEKGSVSIDGISLTIARTSKDSIDISFIPHTMELTNVNMKRSGDTVNIECDIVARYIFQLIKFGSNPEKTTDLTSKTGNSLHNKLESLEL